MGILEVNVYLLHFVWSFGFFTCGEWVFGEVVGGGAVSDEAGFEF